MTAAFGEFTLGFPFFCFCLGMAGMAPTASAWLVLRRERVRELSLRS